MQVSCNRSVILLSTWSIVLTVQLDQAVGNIVEKAGTASAVKKLGFFSTFGHIYRERGVRGFFRGVVPRILLGVYQTLFMVTIARVIKERGLLQ